MFEELITVLEQFEGRVPHLYLDTKGNVTVGVGHLVSSLQGALGLPFLLPSGLPAEMMDITDDWQRILHAEPGRLPGYYAAIADLRLAQADIDALLMSDIKGLRRGLVMQFPQVPTFPQPAQNALMNMAFQLGSRGLVTDYPRLIAACKTFDWQRCADECTIQGAQPERNAANRQFFLSLV